MEKVVLQLGYNVSLDIMDQAIRELKRNYRVFAPKRFEKRGWKPGTDSIRYAEIDRVKEIVYDEQSDFSPKEVFYPISSTMLYFKGDECFESKADDRRTVLFVRPCDINGIRRLDKIFLENGEYQDNYYKRLRKNLVFFMIECSTGWDNCFCVSMAANVTDDYSVAFRFTGNEVLVHVRDEDFLKYFSGGAKSDFTPAFVRENVKKVIIPQIEGSKMLKTVYDLPMWKDYDDKCMSCGSCSSVCITCSCFDTVDIIYDETSRDGERRRVWGSCMLEDFTRMAGGHSVRPKAGDRMRFRTLHKIYDYKERFGKEHMCVGCGRCDNRCPAEISFPGIVNKLNESIKEVREK